MRNKKNKNMNKIIGCAEHGSSKGITLIALVITVVILIILAGVAISLSLGENGIFSKAQQAREEYLNAQDYEETEIAKATNEIDEYVSGNRELVTIDKAELDRLKEQLENYKTNKNVEYVKSYIMGGDASSTYTAPKDGKLIITLFTCRGNGGSLGTISCKKNDEVITPSGNYTHDTYRIMNTYIIDVVKDDIITLSTTTSNGTWYDNGYSICYVN